MHRNILHAQKFEQSYFTGYYVTYCLRSPQLARGTEQTAQCQFTRLKFSTPPSGTFEGDLQVGQSISLGCLFEISVRQPLQNT